MFCAPNKLCMVLAVIIVYDLWILIYTGALLVFYLCLKMFCAPNKFCVILAVVIVYNIIFCFFLKMLCLFNVDGWMQITPLYSFAPLDHFDWTEPSHPQFWRRKSTFVGVINIGRTAEQSLQGEIFWHFLHFQSNLHLHSGSPLNRGWLDIKNFNYLSILSEIIIIIFTGTVLLIARYQVIWNKIQFEKNWEPYTNLPK